MRSLGDIATVQLGLQTNGLIFDSDWIDICLEHKVDVGISLDGPKIVQDAARVDHGGRGSYDRIAETLRRLQGAALPYRFLAVISLGADPLFVHRHLVSLRPTAITYIFPDVTHDNIEKIREEYGPTPCADFLIPIFDEWSSGIMLEPTVRDLWNIARIIMGGTSQIETFGNRPPHYVFIESNGDLEGLDSLRSCAEGLSQIHLNVIHSDIAEIATTETMHRHAIFEGMPVPTACRGCPEEETCAGGYLPHRYSARGHFENASAWCQDILKLFAHIRARLGVSPTETRASRAYLQTLAHSTSERAANVDVQQS
jgi:uncharacterized protein